MKYDPSMALKLPNVVTNRLLTFCSVIAAAWFLTPVCIADQEMVCPEFVTGNYQKTNRPAFIKVCRYVNDQITCLVVSFAKPGDEISLPKFSYTPASGSGVAQFTSVTVDLDGPNVMDSRSWFVLDGGKLIASGPIRFPYDTARKIMDSSDFDYDIIALVGGAPQTGK
jgi:hypothetical protein